MKAMLSQVYCVLTLETKVLWGKISLAVMADKDKDPHLPFPESVQATLAGGESKHQEAFPGCLSDHGHRITANCC